MRHPAKGAAADLSSGLGGESPINPFCHFRRPHPSPPPKKKHDNKKNINKPEKVSEAWLAVLSMGSWLDSVTGLWSHPGQPLSLAASGRASPCWPRLRGLQGRQGEPGDGDLLTCMFLLHLQITGQLFCKLCLSLGLSVSS